MRLVEYIVYLVYYILYEAMKHTIAVKELFFYSLMITIYIYLHNRLIDNTAES